MIESISGLKVWKVRSTPTFVLLTKKPEANKATQRWRASGLVKKDVEKLCARFPLYAPRLEAYDRALARVGD